MSIFSNVKGLRPRKNAFNLSHQIAQTQDIGQILPCYVHDGILPNSRETLSASSIVRFQALLAPMQHKVDMYCHFWYVPYRIIDKDFTRFISGEMERKGETYNCPSISYSSLCQSYDSGWFTTQQDENFGRIVDPDRFFTTLLSPSSFLVYLGYPSVTSESISQELVDGDYSADMNIKRLQAYFFIIAQNYVNENFVFKRGSWDLVELMFDFAFGDFALMPSSMVLSEKVRCEFLLICRFLYDLNITNMSFPHTWKKDYFTSSLPFVQIGDEVRLPVSGSGNISITSALFGHQGSQGGPLNQTDITNVENENGQVVTNQRNIVTGPGDGTIDSIYGRADISDMTAVSINELRAANALQRLKEAYARFGTRFQEWLKGFWNQQSSDRSMNLPEWLGGYKVPVNVSEIEQNSMSPDSSLTGEGTPLGTLAGKGLGVGGKNVYSRHFEEPGVIIGLCFLQPKAVYPVTGLDRMLRKTNDIYDYLTPQMEHLGEQEVFQSELNYLGSSNADSLFGYQSRYAEYKFLPSRYRGQFANFLKFWHLGRDFGDSSPVLSQNFVTINSQNMRRPFAVQTVDDMMNTYDVSSCLLWFNFDVKYIAPMSRFGTPALLN